MGRDFFYTYGPFSGIYTSQFNRPTFFEEMIISLILIAYVFISINILAKARNKYKLNFIILFVLTIGIDKFKDGIFLTIPILAIFVYLSSSSIKITDFKSLLFIILPISVLAFIKGSFVLPTILAQGIILSNFLWRRKIGFPRTVICILLICFSYVFYWVLSGQQISNLFSYFNSMLILTKDYSSSMGIDGPLSDFVILTILLLFIPYKIYKYRKNRILIAIVVFIEIVILFKAGFVRQDFHVYSTFVGLIFLILLLQTEKNRKMEYVTITLFVLVYYSLGNYNLNLTYFQNIWEKAVNKSTNITNTLLDTEYLETLEIESASKIQGLRSFPKIKGTVDIYSYDQGYILANNLNWMPRPMFQSYGTINKKFQLDNYNFIKRENGPANVIFSIQAIDNRVPSSEDGLSWIALKNQFKLREIDENYVYFRRGNAKQEPHNEFFSRQTRLGEVNQIQEVNDKDLYFKVEIKQTWLGKILEYVYKTPNLQINFNTMDGNNQEFRFIPKMFENWTLMSPLVMNNLEFSNYHTNNYTNNNIVDSFRIGESKKYFWFWKPEINIYFMTMDYAKPLSVLSNDYKKGN